MNIQRPKVENHCFKKTFPGLLGPYTPSDLMCHFKFSLLLVNPPLSPSHPTEAFSPSPHLDFSSTLKALFNKTLLGSPSPQQPLADPRSLCSNSSPGPQVTQHTNQTSFTLNQTSGPSRSVFSTPTGSSSPVMVSPTPFHLRTLYSKHMSCLRPFPKTGEPA